MASLSRRVGGNDDYPIFRLTETRPEGELLLLFEVRGPRSLHKVFPTRESAQDYLDALLRLPPRSGDR